jgi:DDE superfamily endonuclease
MSTYQIGHTEFFKSIWSVVKAINDFDGFRFSYPTSHEKQHEIAAGFEKVSGAGFNCCSGAIYGILIWITKPSTEQCERVGCSDAKFFCARKHKFGMNCQAICDVRGCFWELSIMYPGPTSDCLAFEGMTLFVTKLENGILAPGLCLFGDNAYINCFFLATPFSGTAGGSKDAYNFYHSQLRIQIECAFGILTSRWAILRKALPASITIKRAVALVMALARLHNFCMDEIDAKANID